MGDRQNIAGEGVHRTVIGHDLDLALELQHEIERVLGGGSRFVDKQHVGREIEPLTVDLHVQAVRQFPVVAPVEGFGRGRLGACEARGEQCGDGGGTNRKGEM